MKTLDEIKQTLSGNLDVDLDLLYNEITKQTDNETDFFNQMQICKYMKSLCGTYSNKLAIYLQKINKLEKEFFAYIEKKVNIKNGKKQWDNMIYYLNIAFEYFEVTDNKLVFDNFENFFIFATLHQNSFPIKFTTGVEGWLYYRRAIAYKNLKNYDMAIKDFKSCLKCSPMSFPAYFELCNSYLELKDFESLKFFLDKSYNIIKSLEDLGAYYYLYSFYFYNKNNYQLAKACALYSLKFNLSFVMRNKILQLLNSILLNDKVVTDAFNNLPEQVLGKHKLPLWFSKNIMASYLIMYKSCINNIINDKTLQKNVRKKLNMYKLKSYALQIETNETTSQNMYMFEEYEFYFKLDKKWKVVFQKDDSSLVEGAIFECIYNDETLSFVIDRNKEKYDLELLYQENLKTLKNSGFEIIKENNFSTITKKNIKSVLVGSGEKQNVLMNFILLDNNILLIISTNQSNETDKQKLLLNIISTIENFKSINQQIY